MIQPILTIAIPTFNRANFLDNCLLHITNQLAINEDRIELLVSDNCSTDNTFEIVQKYVNKGYTIRYIKNEENIGADRNFNQCFKLALGIYVLLLGDDDIILENGINIILDTLSKSNEYGIVHLNFGNLKHIINENSKNILFNNSEKFIKKIHFHIIFISANIINKKLINFDKINKFNETNLNQLYIFTEAALKAKENIIISKLIIKGGDHTNSGGYDLIKVFGFNLQNILIEIEKKYSIKNLLNIYNKNLLRWAVPYYILILKLEKNNFIKTENLPFKLFKLYNKYWLFWFFILPLSIMPVFLLKFCFKYRYFLLKFLNTFSLGKFNETKIKKNKYAF